MKDSSETQELNETKEDADNHGGWWKVNCFEHMKDDVAIEFLPGCYAKAMSNGTIVMGNPHPPGEGPDEEEIFTAIAASTNQVAFKTGFGRYLGIDSRKRLMGISEAIGEQEIFLPVFEEGKLALSAFNDCFLSPDQELSTADNPQIMAKAMTAGLNEMLTVRINNDPDTFNNNNKHKPTESFSADHSFKEDKILKKARIEGKLHETLLDMRVKQKSDKYCK